MNAGNVCSYCSCQYIYIYMPAVYIRPHVAVVCMLEFTVNAASNSTLEACNHLICMNCPPPPPPPPKPEVLLPS